MPARAQLADPRVIRIRFEGLSALVFSRSTRPPGRRVRRRLGDRGFRQQALGAGAAVAALALVGTYQLAAASAATDGEQGSRTVAAQYVEVAASAAPVPVERDGFEVVRYSIVRWPVDPGSFSGGWGPRSCAGCSSFHMGIDLNAGNGTPVQAMADGVVAGVDSIDGSLGHHIVIRHEIDGETVYSIYAHLQSGSSPMAVGQAVQQGDLVGLIGATGQATAPHLHFALAHAERGAMFDPWPWMVAHVTVPWGS
ncbi:MAG: M23 family metallopeptidase [Actinomycetales bacterium]|nr:M23 family metallopeptidase [Actinomycetales bacterium]